MDDDVNEINEDPGGLGQASNRKGPMVEPGSGVRHFNGQAGHLAIGGAGGNDKEVGDGGKAPKVKDNNIRAVAIQS